MPRGRGLIAVVAVVATLTACSWTQVGGSPQRTGANPYAPGVELATLDALTTAWTSDDHGALADEVIVRDGHAVFPGSQALWSVDATTGADQWHVDRTFGHQTNALTAVSTWRSGGTTIVAMPQSWGDSVSGTAFFQSLAATTTIDLTTGTPIATTEPGGGFAPLVTDTWVYLPNTQIVFSGVGGPNQLLVEIVGRPLAGGASFRLDLSNGAEVPSSMATDGTTLYVTTRSGMVAIPTTGCGAPQCDPSWSVATGGGNLLGPMAVGPHAVYILDRAAGTLWSMPRTCASTACNPNWHASVGSAGLGMAVAGGRVFVTAADTLVTFAADGCGATTCPAQWTSTVAGSGPLTEPTVVNDVVFAGSPDGDLLAWPTAGCGTAACPLGWSRAQGGEVGPVTPISRAILFRVGGAVRKLVLPS